ncbi:protein-glutamate O-methyltransferase CheR [Paenalcaligenes hominis]|uniref:CheR family methyltransferase n=1 Tax=Paenalcaligenes hominis TaxID=643674 RepID=UPI00352661C0
MTQLTESPIAFALPGMPTMTAADFERAARLIKLRSGIVLGSHKEDMVARNLGLCTKRLGLDRVSDYLDHLDKHPESTEWDKYISIFTINHTAFFREQHHFDILGRFVKELKKPISIWSSTCSTGEEAYSIAITVHEALGALDNGVQILATDIDAEAVERAQKGVFTLDRVQPVPQPLLKKYFYRGTGAHEGRAKVKPKLQQAVEFGVANLVSESGWPHGRQFDAVFCRNTMIYFDKPTQTKLLSRFAQSMKPGGLLFVGHSENFSQMTNDFKLQGQTVYVRV